MKIKGFEIFSLTEWAGKVCSVIFLPGCNFRCRYCYNKLLVEDYHNLPDIPFGAIEDSILKHQNWIDAVVVTGGEPTLDPSLPELCYTLHEMNMEVILSTNGSNPDVIQYLIDNNLVDRIGMDIKAPLGQYGMIDPGNLYEPEVLDSINILKDLAFDMYEFRTTVHWKLLKVKDLMEIAMLINGKSYWYIQRAKTDVSLMDPSLEGSNPIDEVLWGFAIKSLKNWTPRVYER
jgi:pyruvate formate lyase activating enzyme